MSITHDQPEADIALRVKAMESLLVEKGLVNPQALEALIDTYEHKIDPRFTASRTPPSLISS